MNIKIHYALILAIFICTSFSSCEKEKQEEIDTFSISYKLENGFSNYRYYVDIDHSGKMKVDLRNGLDNIFREDVYQISNSQIADLKDKLATLSTIELQDLYWPGEDADIPTDASNKIYQYNFNSKSDSTLLHLAVESDLPEELNSFIEVLDGIIEEYDGM